MWSAKVPLALSLSTMSPGWMSSDAGSGWAGTIVNVRSDPLLAW